MVAAPAALAALLHRSSSACRLVHVVDCLRMSLQISTTPVTPDTAVVVFTGNLTLGMTLSSIDSQIQTMIGKGLCRLVFDLTAVSYVDSAGLGVFIHAAGLAREKKGMVRLCGVAERVSTLLKLTGMDAVLPIDADADTSLASLR